MYTNLPLSRLKAHIRLARPAINKGTNNWKEAILTLNFRRTEERQSLQVTYQNHLDGLADRWPET